MSWVLMVGASCISQQSPVQEFRLKISAQEPIAASVEGTINVKDGRLFTGEGGADQFPRHWAQFIRNLEVRDAQGRQLKVTEAVVKDSNRGEWQIDNGYTGPATIQYQVDLDFTKTKWAPSNEKAGYYDGRALYLVTKVLFLASVVESPAKLTLSLPAGDKAATPWNATGVPFQFNVPSVADLQQNTIVVGDFEHREIRQGSFDFTLVVLGKMRDSKDIAFETLVAFAQSFGRLFPTTPATSYLMTIFDADYDNGESFERSSAFVSSRPLTREDVIFWGNTEGHELFHFWCGHQISGASSDQSAWFEEGFTEYYANITLATSAMVSDDLFIKKMENMLGKYLYFRAVPQFEKVPIRDSGTRKTSYRFGVYNGGWAVAFGLDMTIRRTTGGRKNLDDFMRAMYQRFGLSGKHFTYEELVSTANDVAESDLSDFFRRYVAGTETLPISTWLKELGYDALIQDYADEIYIRSLNQTPLRKKWLSKDRF